MGELCPACLDWPHSHLASLILCDAPARRGAPCLDSALETELSLRPDYGHHRLMPPCSQLSRRRGASRHDQPILGGSDD